MGRNFRKIVMIFFFSFYGQYLYAQTGEPLVCRIYMVGGGQFSSNCSETTAKYRNVSDNKIYFEQSFAGLSREGEVFMFNSVKPLQEIEYVLKNFTENCAGSACAGVPSFVYNEVRMTTQCQEKILNGSLERWSKGGLMPARKFNTTMISIFSCGDYEILLNVDVSAINGVAEMFRGREFTVIMNGERND